jgi:3-hydroxyisobutyrate dehydrogenase-like beta-hydroxyacid dehydrogenase
MANIAYLGTGLLGGAFAEASAKRGDSVTAWNRSQDKLTALAQFGVKPAGTPADAVRGATRVHLILKDDAVVEEIIAAALPGLSPDAILIDHTTTQPKRTVERAEKYRAQGLRYLHCPVFMAPVHARNAQGSMLVAGPRALFDAVKDDLSKMTGRLEYLGERADIAAANKLFGNAMIIGLSATLADVLTLAQATGLAGEDALKTLALLDFNGIVSVRGLKMSKGDFTPSFELAMARKDVRLMLETAANRPLAALPAIAARMDQLIAAGHSAKDASVVGIDAVRRER